MAKRGRSGECLLYDVEPDLHIVVHGRPEPLKAHYQLLSLYSKCAKDLPRSADGSPTIWDVSGLVPAGASQPFDGSVVESYLDVIYAHVDPSRRVRLSSHLNDAKRLLLFADAVDSIPLVFDYVSRGLVSKEDLLLHVPVSGQLDLHLVLRDHIYSLGTHGLFALKVPGVDINQVLVQPDALQAAHLEEIPAAVCRALEEWLHLAGRLRMVQLARLLLDFTTTQIGPDGVSVCLRDVGSIFSPCVLHCMPPELLFEGFLRNRLTNSQWTAKFPDEEETTIVYTSPSSATWMGAEQGACETIAVKPAAMYGTRGALADLDGRRALSINLTLGGPDADHTNRIVQQVLTRVLDAE